MLRSIELTAIYPYTKAIVSVVVPTGPDIEGIEDLLGLPSNLPNLVLLGRDDMPAEHETAFIAACHDTMAHLKKRFAIHQLAQRPIDAAGPHALARSRLGRHS